MVEFKDYFENSSFTKKSTGNQNKSIFVNQPTLPSLKEFIPYLEDIWYSKKLTNFGKFHQELEQELARFLGVDYISLFANGTLALISALQVAKISGDVITTPYSFVATTHALKWNGISPIFCDIDPATCNLDPQKIEHLLTDKTSAILPVHVYGNPCKVSELKEIADIYGLKIIYDGAHAFGVNLDGESISNYGDLSILSFHATKVFNTFEGGAIICHDAGTKKRIDYLKNFGFANETTVVAPGINAKMNEMQAAIGLLQLKDFEKNRIQRRKVSKYYIEKLRDIDGLKILTEKPNVKSNYGYFPIFIDKEIYGLTRDQLYEKLKSCGIFSRRYFYPLISHFPTYRNIESANSTNLVNAEKLSNEVICLPIHSELSEGDQDHIVQIIKQNGSL